MVLIRSWLYGVATVQSDFTHVVSSSYTNLLEKRKVLTKKITVSIPEYWFGKRTRPLIYYFTTPI